MSEKPPPAPPPPPPLLSKLSLKESAEEAGKENAEEDTEPAPMQIASQWSADSIPAIFKRKPGERKKPW